MLGSFNSGTLGFGVVLRAKDAFSREFAKFRKELDLSGIAVDRFERKTRNAGAKLAAIGGLSIGLRGAGQLMKDLSNVAGEYEQIETAIKSIAGGELIGGRLIDDLRQYTLESPLGFEELVKNAKKLLAHGIPISDVMDDLKMLTELSAGVGLDKFPFLALAYGQTMAGGRATGQENLQFVNAGIGIRKEVAKLYKDQGGAAMSAAAKELKAEDVKKALYNLTKEGGKFHNLINSQMQTFKGLMSVLADSMYFLKVEMGTVINERYKGILKSMTLLAEQFVNFLLSDRGKGTILALLKVFEVIAIGTFVAALFAGTKFLMYMTGFLLPQATKQTFMLAVMNNRLGRAFGIIFRSVLRLRFAFYNIVLTLAMIGSAVFVLHRAFQSLFHTDYINRFMLIMSTFFELVKNYKTLYTNKKGEGFMIGGDSTLSSDTINKLYANPGTAKFAIGLFVIYADIKRMVFGIAQGMFAILEVAYNIAATIGNAIKKMLEFFGLLDPDDLGGHDTLGGFGFINDKLITNIGRFIGVFLGIKIVYKIVKDLIDAFRLFRKVFRTLRPTNLRRMFATSSIGRGLHRLTKQGSFLHTVFQEVGYAIQGAGRRIKNFTRDTWRMLKAMFRLRRMNFRRNLRISIPPRLIAASSLISRLGWRLRDFNNRIRNSRIGYFGRQLRASFARTGLGRLTARLRRFFTLSRRTRVSVRRLGRAMHLAFSNAVLRIRRALTAIRMMAAGLRRAIVASRIFMWVTNRGLTQIFSKILLIPALILMGIMVLKVAIEELVKWVMDKAPWLAGWFGMSEEEAVEEGKVKAEEDEAKGKTTDFYPAGSPGAAGGGGKLTGDPIRKPYDWEIVPFSAAPGKPVKSGGEDLTPVIKINIDGREVATAIDEVNKKRDEGGR